MYVNAMRRVWVLPAAVAALLAGLWLLFAPPTPDLAAQVYRAGLFEHHGFALFNAQWFAGHHTLGYSLVFPPLAALLGPRVVGALAAVVSAILFAKLAHGHFGDRARIGAVWFAAATATDLFIGRLTFALGVTVALGALLALQRRRTGDRRRARRADHGGEPRGRAVPRDGRDRARDGEEGAAGADRRRVRLPPRGGARGRLPRGRQPAVRLPRVRLRRRRGDRRAPPAPGARSARCAPRRCSTGSRPPRPSPSRRRWAATRRASRRCSPARSSPARSSGGGGAPSSWRPRSRCSSTSGGDRSGRRSRARATRARSSPSTSRCSTSSRAAPTPPPGWRSRSRACTGSRSTSHAASPSRAAGRPSSTASTTRSSARAVRSPASAIATG